jgi:uncharacterized protein YjiS (DUF1127 family)
MFAQTTTPKPAARIGGRPGAFLRALNWMLEADRRRRELAQIARLDDRILDDIGLTREALVAAVRDAEAQRGPRAAIRSGALRSA